MRKIKVGEYICEMNSCDDGPGPTPAVCSCEHNVDVNDVCKYSGDCHYKTEVTAADARQYPHMVEDDTES